MATEHWGVKLELPRPSKRRPSPELTSVQYVTAGLAAVIRARVLKRGAQGAPPYETGRYRYTAAGYPTAAVVTTYPSGDAKVRSSADMHRGLGVRHGSYWVSGGMWQGLSVLQRGSHKAVIAFRGRSLGATSKRRPIKRKGKIVGYRRRSYKVSNALKAWTVLTKHGVHLTMPDHEELHALGDYYAWDAGYLAVEQLGGAMEGSPRGRVLRALRRSAKAGALARVAGV